MNSQKQAKAFIKVSRMFFLVLNWTTTSWRSNDKPLLLATVRKQKILWTWPRKWQAKVEEAEEVPGLIVTYTEEEINTFKDDVASENTKMSTSTSIRRLQSFYLEKYKTELNLNSISKTEAPQLLKHFFFVEIRQTGKENEGKYKPGLTTDVP